MKFCSNFPYNRAGVERTRYVKRQIAKRGIGSRRFDNASWRCDDPDAMQPLRGGDAPRIDALLRKWLGGLPIPFTVADRMPHPLRLSILQSEFALTQVLRPPVRAECFRGGMRENLDSAVPSTCS